MKFKSHANFEGRGLSDDVKDLAESENIVVGTPGRIAELIARKALHIDHVKTLVLNEADSLSSPSFKDRIYDIFKDLGNNTQMISLTATVTPQLQELVESLRQKSTRALREIREDTGGSDKVISVSSTVVSPDILFGLLEQRKRFFEGIRSHFLSSIPFKSSPLSFTDKLRRVYQDY